MENKILLGRGKDGEVFYNSGIVHKKYSPFGKLYAPLTEYLCEFLRAREYPAEFVDLFFLPDGYSYQSEPFKKVSTKELPSFLSSYCALQSKLLRYEIGITDMGLGIDGLNFMKDGEGRFRWVDYGGLGFSFGHQHAEHIDPIVANIMTNFSGVERREAANTLCSETMALFFLQQLDVIYAGVEKGPVIDSLWKARLSSLLAKNELQVYRPGSPITARLWSHFRHEDWTSPVVWEEMSRRLQGMTISVKEQADITALNFEKDYVEVRGYQNFNVRPNSIEFAEQDSHSWTDTKLKTELVENTLISKGCRSYLDFGSNLGVLVFKAGMIGVDSLGIDYNDEYIKVCSKIADHLQLERTNFFASTFQYFDHSGYWDLISLMNIHHHLFGRTDQRMSLKHINDSVLRKCKWLITQFPTELDPKAQKWTGLFPGDGVYSTNAFLEGLGDRQVHVLYDSPTRPIFLIKGDIPE